MRPLLLSLAFLGLGSLALAEETEVSAEAIEEGSGSNKVVLLTLSDWIEANGGIAAVELMLAEEAKEEARQSLKDNPADAEALKEAARNGMDKCEGTSIGSLEPLDGSMDYSDADFSVSLSIPLSAFYELDWENSEIAVGSRGYGFTTNASLLFGDPSAVGDCLQGEIDKAVDRILEERDKLLAGDYSTLKKALAAAAVDYLIDEAYDIDPEFGELLDTIARVCTVEGGGCF
jgi:hypothetical protein